MPPGEAIGQISDGPHSSSLVPKRWHTGQAQHGRRGVILMGPSSLTVLAVVLCRIATLLVDTLRRRASMDKRAAIHKSSILASWLQLLNLTHWERRGVHCVGPGNISIVPSLHCTNASVAMHKAAFDDGTTTATMVHCVFTMFVVLLCVL